MENNVSGFKRKPSERPRSYAICSDSKRAKLEQTEEELTHELTQDQASNVISHVESNFESTVWNQKPETTENNLRNIHFRLENMEYQLKTAKSHIELIKFHMKENHDLLHSELTYALDILGKMDRESQTVKIELLNSYEKILKESNTKTEE
jgi:hypothetical protein